MRVTKKQRRNETKKMKNEQTLEQKVQELLKLDKEIKKIENDRD